MVDDSGTGRPDLVVAGEDKAHAVSRALADGALVDDVPAAGPRGRERTVWWLDEPAATDLPG